jgi:GTP-binding protein Era
MFMTDTKEKPTEFKSGFIAIVGAPNVGKSTLLNRFLGEKISITSKKPQTTRNRILGIVQRPGSQMIFIDTPGIHNAKHELNVRIVEAAVSALGDVDLVLMLADVSDPDERSEQLLLFNLKKQKIPVILALNKIDLIKKPDLLALMASWSKTHSFTEVIPISAKSGLQTEALLEVMEKTLQPGPAFYPEDAITDMPERFIAAEMIREKVFRLTGQEIPYSTAVTIDSFKEGGKGGAIEIHATIHVERNSQKGIVIGRRGSKLKQIGEASRKDIQRMVAGKVFLKLFVRVQKNWSKDTKALRRFGY